MGIKYYSSPEEFKEAEPKLFDEFFDDYFGSHMTMEDIDVHQEFMIHDNLEDFAYYMVTDHQIFGFELEDTGRWPNVITYIDWESLGHDLATAGSDDSFYYTNDDRVIEFMGGLSWYKIIIKN